MGGFNEIFQGVEDPRKSNAAKHDLTEMLTITFLATLTGKSSRSSFVRFAKHKFEFLSEFMELIGRAARSEKLSFNGRRIRIEMTGSRRSDFGRRADLLAFVGDRFDVNGRSFDSAPVDGSGCKGGVYPRYSGAYAVARQHEFLDLQFSDGPNRSMIPFAPQPFGPGFPERLRRNDEHEQEHER